MFRALKKYDFTLMITPILLSAFGIVMIYSASMVTAVVIDDLESTYYFSKQLNWFVFGFIFFMLVCFIPYKFYQKLIKQIILLIVFLLISVLIFCLYLIDDHIFLFIICKVNSIFQNS